MNLQAHREVKSIVDLILMNVSEAIDAIYVHDMVEDMVVDMVEEAVLRSEVINLRRWNRQLDIRNPMNGDYYLVSLSEAKLIWGQLKDVGYDVERITAGSTKHLYAALRAAIPDLRRSTSIRIWYTNDSCENVTVPCTDGLALWLVGKKLFMTRL